MRLVSADSPFMVLLSRSVVRDPVALAKALASARKTPVQDQMVFAKSCWGIVSEHQTEIEARALAESLRALGVDCLVCPDASLTALPSVEEIKLFQPLAAAAPVLISAAAITITSTSTRLVKEGPSTAQKIASTGLMLATGMPIRLGGKERTIEKKQEHSDQVFYLDVIYKEPARRLRINAHQFDYSFLKERKLYQVLGNFKLLVGELVKGTPAAWQNHGTHVLLEGKPMQTMGYNSLTDLERETRWLLTLLSQSAR